MIDIKQIRQDRERFKKAARDKHFEVDIDKLLELDERIGEAKRKLQDIVTEKNRIGKSIPKLSGEEKEAALTQLSELKKREAEYDLSLIHI